MVIPTGVIFAWYQCSVSHHR